MNKVVYTCITGAYDTLKEPKIVSEGWDYICFTDQDFTSDVWKVIKIGKTNNNTLEQRRKKIYNEYIFTEYDLSIWVDGSIIIATDLNNFIKPMFELGYDFALMKHPTRDCIYEEAKACLILNKDNESKILLQIGEYKEEGLPNHVGMVATGIMIRRHTEEVKEFCSKWFDEVKSKSIRDQLSFNYVHWKKPIPHMLMPYGILYNQFLICQHSI
jgi:hypothetical protein